MPLRQRDPGTATAQRTIKVAFESLEKCVSPADALEFGNITLDAVEKTALDIENQLAARQSLRNMRRLSALFSGLRYYSKAIEIVCNGTPYLPWLWAPISMILKISSDYVEAFEQIIKAYSHIAESLTRFSALQESFHQNPAFQQTLAIFYADILEFHKEAYKSVRRSSWKHFFLTSWGRFQGRFDNILDNLKRHAEQLDKEANAFNIVEARNMRQKLQAWREESLAKAKQDEAEQNIHQMQALCSWLRVNDDDQATIIDHVSSEASKHPGTCSWILKQAIIAGWLSNQGHQSNSPLVWLQGNPGCGKSVIASQIIAFLSNQGSVVISYFCTSSYTSSTEYDQVLRSLLFQMIRNSGQMAAYVYGQYVGKKTGSMLFFEQLLQLAASALSDDLGHRRTIHMVIDGLDDLEIDKQKRFLSLMKRISLSTSRNNGALIKILITSRITSLIKECLSKSTVASLSSERDKLTAAITKYSEQRLASQRVRFAELHLQEAELAGIARQVARKAEGMFLWARLVLDYLTHNMFYSGQEIREAVDTLPRKLAEFYRRLLTQMIAKFDDRSVDRLRIIFGWIAFGKRPLRRAEFRSALSYCAGNTSTRDLAPSYLFDMCAPLVEEHADSSLRFIHVSVREYLQDPESVVRIFPKQAYLEHAIATTTCLSSGLDVFRLEYPSSTRFERMIKGLHGFHVFAYQHWIDCILRALSSADTDADATALSQLNSTLSEVSQKLAELSDPSFTNSNTGLPFDPRLELLDAFPPLVKTAKEVLLAQNQKYIKQVDEKTSTICSITRLQDVSDNYQIVLRECLSIHEYPGISAEDLAQFQRDYRSTAFTCRLSSCPRASDGFDTDAQRIDHEKSHTPPQKCPVSSCQYPPFQTEQALKAHTQRCHSTRGNARRRTVRRIDHSMPYQQARVSEIPSSPESRSPRLELYQPGHLLPPPVPAILQAFRGGSHTESVDTDAHSPNVSKRPLPSNDEKHNLSAGVLESDRPISRPVSDFKRDYITYGPPISSNAWVPGLRKPLRIQDLDNPSRFNHNFSSSIDTNQSTSHADHVVNNSVQGSAGDGVESLLTPSTNTTPRSTFIHTPEHIPDNGYSEEIEQQNLDKLFHHREMLERSSQNGSVSGPDVFAELENVNHAIRNAMDRLRSYRSTHREFSATPGSMSGRHQPEMGQPGPANQIELEEYARNLQMSRRALAAQIQQLRGKVSDDLRKDLQNLDHAIESLKPNHGWKFP
ncbi:hypothetical protein F4777DRAFT_557344 [Nemania sp. FL0916]|nr:hypothetical protein F4777DRAFT_557344 [Nemania sp. FL0916]